MPYNTLIHTKEMTKAELFEIVTKMIAEPHSQITEHDKRRAVQVFLAFDEYMVDVDVAAGRCDVGDELEDSILARIDAAEKLKQLLQNGIDSRDGVNRKGGTC
jgi:hypothetical protein